jgi:predicted Mrr-cat superfamily restriction endonuclease
MAIWLVRAGAHGEQEEAALENGMAVIAGTMFQTLLR